MNPMTNVKNISKLNEREIKLGINASCSWHKIYQKSPWVFIGGLDYELTEGDVICVFSQYGEVEDINLVRDKKTGKSKGFGFLCYQNNKSTILAVDNFNGIKLCGHTIRVDHVANYRPPKQESESDEDGSDSAEDIMDVINPKRKKEKKRRYKEYEEEAHRTKNAFSKHVDRDNRGKVERRPRDFVSIKNENTRERDSAKYFDKERESYSYSHRDISPTRHFKDERSSHRKHNRMDSSSDESVERHKTKKKSRTEKEIIEKSKQKSKQKWEKYDNYKNYR